MELTDKIFSEWDKLEIILNRKRAAGERIVATNGCFDLLHIGHVRYLHTARELGDCLVVGLNSDRSVRRLKGAGRPINPQEERAEMLAALSSVDYVAIFDEETAHNLLKRIRPDIYVKGGDYTPDVIPEAPLIRAMGGKVVVAQLVPGRSTTQMLERLAAEELANLMNEE